MNTRYTSLVDALKDLQAKGYTYDFKVLPEGLLCFANGICYTHEVLKVKEVHRFESDTDPAGNEVLYVIETNDGLKGTLITGYGIYTDPREQELLEKLQMDRDDPS